jgi:hypothetical protein
VKPVNYIHETAVVAHCKSGQYIEQFLCAGKEDDFNTLEWIAIGENKKEYTLTFHRVFDDRDDRDEGGDDIYHFSYVVPDDLNGVDLLISENIDEVLEFARIKYGAKDDSYLPFGYLNKVILGTNFEK